MCRDTRREWWFALADTRPTSRRREAFHTRREDATSSPLERQIRKDGEAEGTGKVMRVATSSATTLWYPRYYPRPSEPLTQIQFWYVRASDETRCKTYKFALRWSQPEDKTRRLTRAKDARVHDVVRRRRALLTSRGRLMARGRRRMQIWKRSVTSGDDVSSGKPANRRENEPTSAPHLQKSSRSSSQLGNYANDAIQRIRGFLTD